MSESALRAISDAWHGDADFRAAVEEDPRAALASKGLEIHGPAEVSVVVDTGDTAHVVFPPDPNETLSDITLDGVSGGTSSCWQHFQQMQAQMNEPCWFPGTGPTDRG